MPRPQAVTNPSVCDKRPTQLSNFKAHRPRRTPSGARQRGGAAAADISDLSRRPLRETEVEVELRRHLVVDVFLGRGWPRGEKRPPEPP
jgi:hypothetical protein